MADVTPERPRIPTWAIPVGIYLLSVLVTAILAWAQLQAIDRRLTALEEKRLEAVEARIDRIYTDTMPEITGLNARCDSHERRIQMLEDR